MTLHACQTALHTIPTVTLWSRPFLYFLLHSLTTMDPYPEIGVCNITAKTAV